jgi:outer membrane protein assembly factor BamB
MHQTVFEWDYRSPMPVLEDGVLYVGSADGGFHAVKADTGERVWRFETKSRIRADALLLGAGVVFGNQEGEIFLLERATGKEKWKREVHSFMNATPALAAGRLIIGLRGGPHRHARS